MPTPSSYSVKSNWRQELVEYVDYETIPVETTLPVNSTSNRTPLTFVIRPITGRVTDVSRIRLLFTYSVQRVTSGAWSAIKSTDKIAPYNGTGFSLFEDLVVNLNGTHVESAQREYCRTSYIKNLLLSTERYQKSVLQNAQFYADAPSAMNSVSKDARSNLGEYLRSKAIEDNRGVTVLTPLLSDILSVDSFYPDSVTISIRLYPAKSQNCLVQEVPEGQQPVQCRFQILSAVLLVERCKLKTQIPKNIVYNYDCFKMLSYSHPKSLAQFGQVLSTGGVLPKIVLMMILSESQYQGDYTQCGVKFLNHSVSNVTVHCNGKALPGLSGMDMDYSAKSYCIAWDSLFTKLHAANVLFDHKDMDDAYNFWAFELKPGSNYSSNRQSKVGSCSTEISFSVPPPENLMILALLIYDTKFIIGSNGDFHPEIAKLQ